MYKECIANFRFFLMNNNDWLFSLIYTVLIYKIIDVFLINTVLCYICFYNQL